MAIGNGAGCGTSPVGSNAAVDIPVIVLFLAFLPLRASNCNGWARTWGPGRDAKGAGEDDASNSGSASQKGRTALTGRQSGTDRPRRIVVTTFGSLDDLYPYLALALGMRARGHDVVVATGKYYRDKVEALGLGFAPVRPDSDWVTDLEMMRRYSHPRWGLIRVAQWQLRLFLSWGMGWLARPWHRLRREIGLPAATDLNPLTDGHSPKLHLALFSKRLMDKQPDWPPQTLVTGFPWYDQPGSTALPPMLAWFLDAGPCWSCPVRGTNGTTPNARPGWASPARFRGAATLRPALPPNCITCSTLPCTHGGPLLSPNRCGRKMEYGLLVTRSQNCCRGPAPIALRTVEPRARPHKILTRQ